MSSFAIRIIAIPVLALAAAVTAVFYFRPPQTGPAVAIAPPSASPDAQQARPAPPRQQASPAPPPQSTAGLPPPPAPGGEPSAEQGAAPTAPRVPEFDIVRVAPSGETVVAGRAPGAARVELLDRGKVIASEKVDRNGEFVILPPALGNGDHLLALRITPEGQAAVASNQSVAVVVRPGTSPIVTLAEPGKPSVILAAPVPVPAPAAAAAKAGETASAPASAAQVTIQTAEVEAGGRFFATGTARPGSTVRLYLNGSHVADAAAANDGKWSLTINKGVSGGKYALRADVVGEQGKVVSRAEVPFEAPAALAAAPMPPVRTAKGPTPPTEPLEQTGTSPAPANQTAAWSPPSTSPAIRTDQAPQTPAALRGSAGRVPAQTGTSVTANNPASNAVVPEIASVTVARGDSLWRISRQRLGKGMRYTVIYEANSGQIRNPNLIYSGQVFVLPGN